MPIYNRLVTRGFSKSTRNTLIGKGHIKTFIDETRLRVLRMLGARRSGKDSQVRRDDDFVISAHISRINKKNIDKNIKNTLKVTIPANSNIVVRGSKNIKIAIKDAINVIFIKAGISRWK